MADGEDKPGADLEEHHETKPDFANWMSKLPPKLCCESLKNIAIPGGFCIFFFSPLSEKLKVLNAVN